MGARKLFFGLWGAGLLVTLAACSLPGSASQPTQASSTPTPTLIPTQLTLAPILPSATPTVDLAPTALPAPTEILPPTAAPADANQTGTPGASVTGPGITLNPALGEPGDTVIVAGTGFAPGETVALHWNAPGGNTPTGPVYWEAKADGNGFFSVGLIVPPAAKWPGGAPQERAILQLRATAPSLGYKWVFANFTYIIRYNPLLTATPEPPTPTP